MAKRYAIKLSHTLSESERDVRKKLRHSGTWRDGKKATPESGEWATGSVELTPSEVAKVEAASNVLYVEETGRKIVHVDEVVPSDTDLRGHKADMLYEWGFTGSGIDVGWIDDGIGSAALSRFDVKAIRAFGYASTDNDPEHGSQCAALAVPRNARLVFGAANDTADIADAIYWMADDSSAGVHVLGMSFQTDDFQHIRDAIAHIRGKGVTVFASAGNDSTSTPQYPAHYEGVTAVGALDRTAGWKRAAFSNYGAWVDLWMNGVSVATYNASGNLVYVNGTSFSTPLAAYVHASLLTKGLTSIGQISTREAARQSGDAVPTGLGGGRRVNGERAAFAMKDFC